MKISSAIIASSVIFASVVSCKKDKDTKTTEPAPNPTTVGSLKINFENKVDIAPLEFGKNYFNQKGDSFTVSKFSYYISNIVVTKTDGSTFSEPESYHLVSHSSPATSLITIPNVPVGSYKSIAFTIGVDSARNVSGVQSGDLSPVIASDMFWSWNTGYIFLKLEGASPKSGAADKSLIYHIGGYGGVYKTQRNVTLNFGTSNAVVNQNSSSSIYITANANKLFGGTNIIDVSTTFFQMSIGKNANFFADNYADMMSFNRIEN
jgi:hypothetical protein